MARKTVGYIPRNLGGGTVWDGRLKSRNAIEAVIIITAIGFATKILELFLPYLVFISIRIILCGIFGLLAAVGINGEPLSVYVLNIINYSNTRTYVTIRPPLREVSVAEEKKSLLDRMFTGPRRKRNAKKNDASDMSDSDVEPFSSDDDGLQEEDRG